jgi:hypothetical protein
MYLFFYLFYCILLYIKCTYRKICSCHLRFCIPTAKFVISIIFRTKYLLVLSANLSKNKNLADGKYLIDLQNLKKARILFTLLFDNIDNIYRDMTYILRMLHLLKSIIYSKMLIFFS